LSGRAAAPELAYRKTVIRGVSASLAIERGRLAIPDLSARVGDSPLKARLALDLAEPWAYEGELDAGGLPCQDLLALVPHVPDPVRITGTITGRGAARGTVRPWRMESSGQARIDHFRLDRIPVGDLPLRWTTQGETIIVSVQELERYGGRISAETRVPVHGDRPVDGTITMVHVDTAPLSAEVPE